MRDSPEIDEGWRWWRRTRSEMKSAMWDFPASVIFTDCHASITNYTSCAHCPWIVIAQTLQPPLSASLMSAPVLLSVSYFQFCIFSLSIQWLELYLFMIFSDSQHLQHTRWVSCSNFRLDANLPTGQLVSRSDALIRPIQVFLNQAQTSNSDNHSVFFLFLVMSLYLTDVTKSWALVEGGLEG